MKAGSRKRSGDGTENTNPKETNTKIMQKIVTEMEQILLLKVKIQKIAKEKEIPAGL